jgi:hypothetical protein
MRVVAFTVTEEVARGIGAVRLHVVLTEAVEAPSHKVRRVQWRLGEAAPLTAMNDQLLALLRGRLGGR